jgi:hypothetical protein
LKQVFFPPVAFTILEKKIWLFPSFSLSVKKIFGISEHREQNLTSQGTFLQKNSFLDVIVSKKMFKEELTVT